MDFAVSLRNFIFFNKKSVHLLTSLRVGEYNFAKASDHTYIILLTLLFLKGTMILFIIL